MYKVIFKFIDDLNDDRVEKCYTDINICNIKNRLELLYKTAYGKSKIKILLIKEIDGFLLLDKSMK